MKKLEYLLTEDSIVNSLMEYLRSCNRQELSRLTGELFGGECFYQPDIESYIFNPNNCYTGEFD